METQKTKSTLGFNLFIDEEAHKGIQLLVNIYLDILETEKGQELMAHPEFLSRKKGISNLLEKMIVPQHELGWCHDPLCTYEENKKK